MELECLLAFMNGLQSKYIKRKLGEHNVSEFNEAVKLAMRFEKIEKITNPPAVHSIMKQKSNVSFEPKVEEHPASSTDDTQQEAVALRQTPYRSRPRERASTDNRGASRDSYNRSWSKDRNRSWSRDSNQRSLSRTLLQHTEQFTRQQGLERKKSIARQLPVQRSRQVERKEPSAQQEPRQWGTKPTCRYPIRRNQSNKARFAEEESQQEMGTPDMSFQAIDTPLSLGDIVRSEQEGKRPQKVKPKPLTTDQPGTSQQPKRSSSRYNLRIKPAKRKIFGWSSEKKQ